MAQIKKSELYDGSLFAEGELHVNYNTDWMRMITDIQVQPVKLKKERCPNCGATEIKNNKCAYCGT